jgi:hypothetical protein
MNYNVDLSVFQKVIARKNKQIETIDLAEWIECSSRYIQKWCKRNNIEKWSSSGREYYIWNEKSLGLLQNSLKEKQSKKIVKDRKLKDKKINKYYKPRPRPEIKFTTVQEFAEEIKITRRYIYSLPIPISEWKVIEKTLNEELSFTAKLYWIRWWCRKNNIPKQRISGREYFVITDDEKSQMINWFCIYPIEKRREIESRIYSSSSSSPLQNNELIV